MAEPNIPIKALPWYTSTSVITIRNNSLTLVEEIKKYKTDALIKFLQKEKNLGLDDDNLGIIRKQKIMGHDFLKMSKEEFLSYGLLDSSAKRLANFAKECKEKKLRAFSSYKTKKNLSKVLHKIWDRW